MAEESDIPRRFGFSDLHSFKDYVTMVLACAPELFFEEDWLPPEEQLDLEKAFEGLEIGYRVVAREVGEIPLLARCRQLTSEALERDRAGQDFEGQQKLEQVELLINSLPSR